jgi:replicative DNA helicase
MNDFYEQPIPWAPDAEAGVLSAILMDNNAFDNVADVVTADAFHDERAGIVFAAIAGLVMAGKPADVLTVHEAVSLRGISLADLNAYAQAASSARHARHYAQIVAEKHLSRRLLTAADDVKTVAFDFAQPVQDRIGQAQSMLEQLQDKAAKGRPQPIQDFIAGAIDRIQAFADGDVAPGIPTRIPSIDRRLGGGLKGGKQMILAARPSVGKSSLAEQICVNIAMDGHPAAMFSMEMSSQEMTDRAICSIGRVDMERYSLGKLEPEEWTRFSEAIEQMRNIPIFFDEQPAMTLPEIAAKARMLKRKNGIKLLVLDYIQLCGTTNPKLSRHHQLEELSRGLKALAKQLDISILTLSQLNREVEKRTSGRPQLSDLKESGAIEEDADVVMLMWCQEKKDGYQLNGLDMAKVRGGRTGQVALHFEGQYQRWHESTESLNQAKKGSYGGEL